MRNAAYVTSSGRGFSFIHTSLPVHLLSDGFGQIELLEEIKLFGRMEEIGDIISHFLNFTNHMR